MVLVANEHSHTLLRSNRTSFLDRPPPSFSFTYTDFCESNWTRLNEVKRGLVLNRNLAHNRRTQSDNCSPIHLGFESLSRRTVARIHSSKNLQRLMFLESIIQSGSRLNWLSSPTNILASDCSSFRCQSSQAIATGEYLPPCGRR